MSTNAMTQRNGGALVSVTSQLFNQFSEERHIVLAPKTHLPELPRGTRLSVTEVGVDTRKEAKETFQIAGGELMLGKVVLDRIAAAAGISWLEERRVDDAKHPHACQMFVRGKITDFDGSVREVTGTKMVDLREDAGGGEMGKDYAEIIAKAKKGDRDPSNQIMEARKFIAEIAASKAKNRAIASALGIKRAYSKRDLDSRTFVVPKLIPDTNHAETRQAVMANMLGATAALYGARASQAQVIDQEFEEADTAGNPPPSDGVGQEASGGRHEPGASTIPHDSETGEVLDNLEVGGKDAIQILTEAWKVFHETMARGVEKEAGVSFGEAKAQCRNSAAAAFRKLCESNSGKARKEDMTLDDAKAVWRAVDAFTANTQGQQEQGDLPI